MVIWMVQSLQLRSATQSTGRKGSVAFSHLCPRHPEPSLLGILDTGFRGGRAAAEHLVNLPYPAEWGPK